MEWISICDCESVKDEDYSIDLIFVGVRKYSSHTRSMNSMPQVCGRTDFSKQLVKDRRLLFHSNELRSGFHIREFSVENCPYI